MKFAVCVTMMMITLVLAIMSLWLDPNREWKKSLTYLGSAMVSLAATMTVAIKWGVV